MKLSMWILADWLKKYAPTIMIKRGDPILYGVRMVSEGITFENHNVYLGYAKEYVSDFEKEIICVNGEDMIILDTTDIDLVLNDIFDAFDFYNKWTDDITNMIYQGCTLQDIVNRSHTIFNNPIVIYDSGYMVTAISSEYDSGELDEEWTHLQKHRSNSIEMLTFLNPYLHKARNSNEVHSVCYDDIGYPCLLRNLFIANDNIGMLMIVSVFNTFTKGSMHLCDSLAVLLEKWLKSNKEQELMRNECADFYDLLEAKNIPPQNIVQRMELAGWDRYHSKILLKIMNPNYYEETGKALTSTFKRILDNCYIMNFESSIVILANVSLRPLNHLIEDISPELVKSHYYCSVSYEFSDVLKLKEAYDQCTITLKYSPREDYQVYYCEDFAVDYIYSTLKSQINTNMVHPALAVLKEHDEKYNSQLYYTLYKYLENERSIVTTAAALNLHRNSLLYRIDKINQLVDLNLNDIKTRAYLLLSFRLEN